MATDRYQNLDTEFFKKYTSSEYYIDRGVSGYVYGPIEWNGEELAIKEIAFAADKVTGKLKEDIERKKKMWISLEHKNLTRIHAVDISQLPRSMNILMEFAAGGSLNKTLRSLGSEPGLPIDVVTDWAKQIAEGMMYLHQKNIVHRDLKSSNVLLMEPFDVRNPHKTITLKITDFDEAKELQYTATVTFVGTCAYMAPEVRLQEHFSKGSDVWSFGVLIWEMLSGNIPHNGLLPTAIMSRTAKGKFDDLSLEQSFPEDYKSILRRCWKSERKDRLTFHELFNILQRMAKGKDVTKILKCKRNIFQKFFSYTPRESHECRSNHQFLLMNINSSRLINPLYEQNCISDDERDHLLNLPNDDRNDALLRWMTTICENEDIWKKFLESFRQTDQKFVADFLENKGVITELRISTKLVKKRQFCKSSINTYYLKELKEKEAMVIKRLNQQQGLSLHSSQHAISEIPYDDIVIAPYCRQEQNGVAIWLWCHSKNELENLKDVYASGELLGKIATLFKKFSKDSALSDSTLLVPTDINQSVSHFSWWNPKEIKILTLMLLIVTLGYDLSALASGFTGLSFIWQTIINLLVCSSASTLAYGCIRWKTGFDDKLHVLVHVFVIFVLSAFGASAAYSVTEYLASFLPWNETLLFPVSILLLVRIVIVVIFIICDMCTKGSNLPWIGILIGVVILVVHFFSLVVLIILTGIFITISRRCHIDCCTCGKSGDYVVPVTEPEICGLTILHQEVFISRQQQSVIEVYDLKSFLLKRRMSVDGMTDPGNLVSCTLNNCLYTSDLKYQEQLPFILRIDPFNGNLIKTWQINEGRSLLSVASDANVIICIKSEAYLHEYTPNGEVIRKIDLGRCRGLRTTRYIKAKHAVKLDSGLFVVCQFYPGVVYLLKTKETSCTSPRIDEAEILKNFEEPYGKLINRLRRPVYLSVDTEGSILVSDMLHEHALLLSPDLDKPQILLSTEHGMASPESTCYDQSSGKWFVTDGRRIIVCWIENDKVERRIHDLISHENIQDQLIFDIV